MNEDRIEGTVKKVKGAAQEAIGDVANDDTLAAKGILNQAVGSVQDGYGKVRDKVKDLVGDAPATAKDAVETGRDYVRRGSAVVTRTVNENSTTVLTVGIGAVVVGALASWLLVGRGKKKTKPKA